METIERIRCGNLRHLVDSYGSVQALAHALGKSSSQVSQWLNASPDSKTGKPRSISNQSAREIEIKTGSPPGWMDQIHQDITARYGAIERGNVRTRPRPCVIVEEGTPLNDDEVEVPRLALKLSAGNGRLAWEINQKGAANRFRRSWCERKGLKPEALVTVLVSGDSMTPTIPDGASVTIDISNLTLRNGKPHAIDYMGEFFIKRLFRQPDGSLLVRSDNPDKTRHPDWTIPIEHGDALRILGAPVSISADLD